MSPLGAVLVGCAAVTLLQGRTRMLAVPALVVSWLQPLLGLAGATAALLIGWRNRLRRRRVTSERKRSDVVRLAELLGLSLAAGSSLHTSLAKSRDYIGSALRAELDLLLRGARRSGLAAALAETPGAGHELYRLMARAVSTGAPLGAAVDSFVNESLSEERTHRLVEARRIPVKLMVPLALFILPGFVLMILAPALSSTLNRLVIPT